VKRTQSSAAVATALKAFLNWTITTGSSDTFLGAVGFEPLPSNVKTIAQTLISGISG
jgi:ABC-type phosphate transport system substrate-binding protein